MPTVLTWSRESIHPIEWPVPTDLGVLDSTVTVETSYDSAATWTVLAEVSLTEQYQRWVIPATGPTHGRARVTFHRTDGNGTEIPLRRIETPDMPFGPSQKRNYAWQKVAAEAPFGSRDGAGGVVFNGKMWLIGGWNGDRFPLTCTNDVWSSTDGATWTQEKPNTFLDPATFNYAGDWEGRHFAGYQVFDGKMWILGGDVVQGIYQTDIWSSTDGRQWTRRDVHTSTPRSYLVTNPASQFYGQIVTDYAQRYVEEAQFGLRTLHITGVFNNKLFLMGGQRIEQFVNPIWPGAPAKLFNDVWSSNDGATWTQVPTTGPMWAPRALVSEVVSHNGRMWMIGGGAYDDPTAGRPNREFQNDVWSTADGARWEKSSEKPPFSPRIWHNVKAFDGRMWVINGYDGYLTEQGRSGDNLGDVWYSTDGNNWYEASPPSGLTGFIPRHAGTVWVHNGSIFVGSGNAIGTNPGIPGQYKWYAEVWKMTPVP